MVAEKRKSVENGRGACVHCRVRPVVAGKQYCFVPQCREKAKKDRGCNSSWIAKRVKADEKLKANATGDCRMDVCSDDDSVGGDSDDGDATWNEESEDTEEDVSYVADIYDEEEHEEEPICGDDEEEESSSDEEESGSDEESELSDEEDEDEDELVSTEGEGAVVDGRGV